MSAEVAFGDTLTPEQSARPAVDPIELAVGELACDRLVIVHNASVYAVVGNANSPTVLDDIKNLKDDPARSTLGWATTLARPLQLADTKSIKDTGTRALLESPHELTERTGGLAFVRMPVRRSVLRDSNVPAGIVDRERGTVQPYSATGSDFFSRLVRAATSHGVEPVLSSANMHGQPEIVDRAEAERFAKRAPYKLAIIEDAIEPHEGKRPVGSYPILNVTPEGFELVRAGCFSEELILGCFDGGNAWVAPEARFMKTKYPDGVFGIEHLPGRYQDLRGPLLRLAVLATLNWQKDAHALLQQQLVQPG